MSDGDGGQQRMVERQIEGEYEADLQAQEDAEEVLCDGVARALTAEALGKAWTVLVEFVEAYKREVYRAEAPHLMPTKYVTDEAYETACKLLGRQP